MTSGALSFGGPGRSVVGRGITSNTSGALGPEPLLISQFVPPNTRVTPTFVHVVEGAMVTLSLVTARAGLVSATGNGADAPVRPGAAVATSPVVESWLPVVMLGAAVTT